VVKLFFFVFCGPFFNKVASFWRDARFSPFGIIENNPPLAAKSIFHVSIIAFSIIEDISNRLKGFLKYFKIRPELIASSISSVTS